VKVVTGSEMKEIEGRSLDFGLSFMRLMENAGSAAAAFVKRNFKIERRNCVIFCGKGNNGGDGFVVARKLAEGRANALVILMAGKPAGREALAMYEQLDAMGVPILAFDAAEQKLPGWLAQADLVVDAICGTGFLGQLREKDKRACALINAAAAAVLALDIPTGVECDSGKVADGAVKADYTLVFDSLKPCHVAEQSLPHCGTIEVLDIGIPDEARQPQPPQRDEEENDAPPPPPPRLGAMTVADVFALLPPRRPDAHKGDFGRVVNIAGSARYRGAAVLSTLGALRCGAGLVTLASTEAVCACAAVSVPEATFLPMDANDIGTIDGMSPIIELTDALQTASAVSFGCGLENNLHTARLLESVLKQVSCPILLDADGINALSGNIHLLDEAKSPVVLTPHPGEMARLCGTTVEEVQADRAGVALAFAAKHGVILLLKGQETLIVTPDGQLIKNKTGNPGLAKGGSGDVLTGIIAALIAQGLDLVDAAACGAFLHGMAADRTAKRRSQTAMLPHEILDDLAGIFLEHGR